MATSPKSSKTSSTPVIASIRTTLPSPTQCSLHLGNLASSVTEAELARIFSQVGPITTVRVCTDKRSNIPRGYGYVSYATPEEAQIALREFNHYPIEGKLCRLTRSRRGNVDKWAPPAANLFVKNLPLNLSAVAFHDTFEAFGEVVSSKLALDAENKCKGYGFVQYATPEQAQTAISESDGSFLDLENHENVDEKPKPLSVSLFVPRQAREVKSSGFHNVFIKNLSTDLFQEEFEAQWSKFGKITSSHLTKGKDDKFNTGFVNYENSQDAAAAVKSTKKNGPEEVYATRAYSKTERLAHQTQRQQK